MPVLKTTLIFGHLFLNFFHKHTPWDTHYQFSIKTLFSYVRARETGDWDLFLGPLEWARAETGGLTDGCYNEGDSQGLPGFIHPLVLGIPTVSFQLKLYSHISGFCLSFQVKYGSTSTSNLMGKVL